MKYNCQKLVESMGMIKGFLPAIDLSIKNRSLELDALNYQKNIKQESDSIIDYYCGDQIGWRDEVAKEKNYYYVGKFNKSGIAFVLNEGDKWTSSKIKHKKVHEDTRSNFLIDREGNQIIPEPGFEGDCFISDFSEGLAAVEVADEKNGKTFSFYIDETGKRIDDINYREAGSFRFGQALVRFSDQDDFHYSIIDRTGQVVRQIVLEKYTDDDGHETKDEFRWYAEGYLGLHRPGYGAWYITPSGKRIPEDRTKFFQDNMGDLNTGIAKVSDRTNKPSTGLNKDRYFIDQQGNRINEGILSRNFGSCTDFYNDRALVKISGNKNFFIINSKGEIISEIDTEQYGHPADREKDHFGKDPMVFMKYISTNPIKVIWYLIDRNGKELMESHEPLRHFSEGVGYILERMEEHKVEKDGKENIERDYFFNLITEAGKIIKPEVDIQLDQFNVGMFHDGVGRVLTSDGKKIFIDKKGRKVF